MWHSTTVHMNSMVKIEINGIDSLCLSAVTSNRPPKCLSYLHEISLLIYCLKLISVVSQLICYLAENRFEKFIPFYFWKNRHPNKEVKIKKKPLLALSLHYIKYLDRLRNNWKKECFHWNFNSFHSNFSFGNLTTFAQKFLPNSDS